MNRLVGVICDFREADGIAYVKVDAGRFTLGVMSLGGEWRVGERVQAIFKESDVLIAHKDSGKLSARNKFVSKVSSIQENGVLARVEFAEHEGNINSLISYEALKELEIRVGEEFLWFVKSSEIILERV